MEGDKDLVGDQVPLAVQATNDDSIVSKRSAARFGYFDDEFLRAFVRKPPRRSQLINRGYYIRCFAIRTVLREFLKLQDEKTGQRGPKQIVSLGAGFDTSFWVLKTEGAFQEGDRYIEVDFPELIARKSEVNKTDPILKPLLGESVEPTPEQKEAIKALTKEVADLKKEQKKRQEMRAKEILARTAAGEQQPAMPTARVDDKTDEEISQKIKEKSEALHRLQHEIHVAAGYSLVAGDLRDLPALQKRLGEAGIDFSRPTLLFAECVFTCILHIRTKPDVLSASPRPPR